MNAKPNIKSREISVTSKLVTVVLSTLEIEFSSVQSTKPNLVQLYYPCSKCTSRNMSINNNTNDSFQMRQIMKIYVNKITIQKTLFLKLTLLLSFALSPSAYAQLANGNYTFSSADNTLQFTIADEGFSIKNVTLSNKSSGQIEKQTGGELMKQGDAVWYQFQTDLCNYEFDVPTKTIKLSRFDCKDKKIKKATMVLKKN